MTIANTTSAPPRPAARRAEPRRGALVAGALGLVLVAAMAYNTRVVRIGSEADVQAGVFSPETFGIETFPAIRDSIRSRAVEAATLSSELAADRTAASAKYGIGGGNGTGPVIPVRFTGVVGEGRSGVYRVAVEGVPAETTLRVQTGPAINGTELRDATGEISFGQFRNQIEYQNAGAALNEEMKREVLGGVDASTLTGKTVSVTGVFRLVNPKNWLVTPVEIAVP